MIFVTFSFSCASASIQTTKKKKRQSTDIGELGFFSVFFPYSYESSPRSVFLFDFLTLRYLIPLIHSSYSCPSSAFSLLQFPLPPILHVAYWVFCVARPCQRLAHWGAVPTTPQASLSPHMQPFLQHSGLSTDRQDAPEQSRNNKATPSNNWATPASFSSAHSIHTLNAILFFFTSSIPLPYSASCSHGWASLTLSWCGSRHSG